MPTPEMKVFPLALTFVGQMRTKTRFVVKTPAGIDINVSSGYTAKYWIRPSSGDNRQATAVYWDTIATITYGNGYIDVEHAFGDSDVLSTLANVFAVALSDDAFVTNAIVAYGTLAVQQLPDY